MKLDLTKYGYDPKELNTYLILLSAPVLLSVYYYFGYSHFYMQTFVKNLVESPLGEFNSRIYQFVSFFILMFVVPAVFLKPRIGMSFTELGMGLGDKKFGFKLIAIILPILIPVMYFATNAPDIIAEYPLSKTLYQRPDLVFPYELAYILFYYIAWEFYFRGFLLFSLEKKFGGINAILIQTISSCLIHIGKPAGETIGSIIVGVIFGYLALRTRSIWYVLILHVAIGVSTDLYVLFFHGVAR